MFFTDRQTGVTGTDFVRLHQNKKANACPRPAIPFAVVTVVALRWVLALAIPHTGRSDRKPGRDLLPNYTRVPRV